MKRFIAPLIIILINLSSNAQPDSVVVRVSQNKLNYKKFILPTSMIVFGSLISSSKIERDFQGSVRSATGKDFLFRADDYTRYAPIAIMYIADLAGAKAKNHWFDQTKNLAISIVVSDFLTFRLKKWVHKSRPGGSDYPQSFPSGHSSFAFTNATVAYNELIDSSPSIAYAGYGFATATGALRVLNNAHYAGDVLVGVGIGILVGQGVCALDPIIKWNPLKKTKGIVCIPAVENKRYGFYLCKVF